MSPGRRGPGCHPENKLMEMVNKAGAPLPRDKIIEMLNAIKQAVLDLR